MTAVAIPRHIAIVEDDRDSGQAICDRLARKGFEPHLVVPAAPDLEAQVVVLKIAAAEEQWLELEILREEFANN